MGIFLSCEGLSCIQNSLPDDNQLFSHLSSGTPAIYKNYRISKRVINSRLEFDLSGEVTSPLMKRSNWSNGNDWGGADSLWVAPTDSTANVNRCAIKLPSIGD